MQGGSFFKQKSGAGKNEYLYNNKEQQFDLANQYDYGTRFYDPTVARWAVVDPMAEKYYSYSNYSYAVNNPILFIDPTGAEIIPVAGGYKFTEEDAISAFDIFKNKRHINVYLCITRNKNFQNQTDQDRAMSGQWDVFGVDSFEEGVDVLNALGEVADFTMDNLIIETHGSINSDHIAGIKVNDYNDNDLSQGSYIHNNELDLANGKIPNATLAHNPAIAEKLATFKKITDRITDGGKLIFASCIVGVGEAGKKFGENLNEFTGSRLNIFLAKDYVTPGWYRDKSDGSLSIWFSRMFQATWLQTKADGTQNNVQSITLSAVVGTPPVTVVPAPEKTHHKKGN